MATYSIRELADRFGVQPSTLRYYEDQELLTDVDRDDAGRRIYSDHHVDRLKAISCFKHAGMSLDELKRFFAYESDERAHITQMVELLEHRRDAIVEQRATLEDAYMHVLRKLHLYRDIQSSIEHGTPYPDWADYADKDFRP
ncbi:MerR family transcriptional regulator [Bifidobacterium sp.]|uniref:MerR family transcriptional regulator n=1 Tax=Bifidobacterium sp. TaxID=41200 RepID=UPI003D7CEA45